MPRSKFPTGLNEDTLVAANIANLKILTTDLLHDFRYIYKIRTETLENSVEESVCYELIQKHKWVSNTNNYPLQYKNRIYILASIDRLMLLVLDMAEPIVENLIDVIDCLEPSRCDLIIQSTYIFPHIFIFQGKKLAAHALIRPEVHAELMAVFAKENKVDFNGARYDYYTRPKIEARRNKDK